MCPHLNPVQLMHILNAFQPDELAMATDLSKAKMVLTRMVARSPTSMKLLLDPSVYLTYQDVAACFS